jgi:hypothetical protein
VFAIGFWTHGVMPPAGHETTSDGGTGSPAAIAVVDHPAEANSPAPAAVPEIIPAADPVVDGMSPRPEQVAAIENAPMAGMMMPPEITRRRPRPATVAHAANDLQTWGLGLPAVAKPDPTDGFALKTPGFVQQVSAEVIRPARAWFETAVTDEACTSGTCPAPVARLDRKLNTALEWSASPAAAAEQAERERKLVFLIHVSGNFAQPGFT